MVKSRTLWLLLWEHRLLSLLTALRQLMQLLGRGEWLVVGGHGAAQRLNL